MRIRIRDPESFWKQGPSLGSGMEWFGSGRNIPDPQHCYVTWKYRFSFFCAGCPCFCIRERTAAFSPHLSMSFPVSACAGLLSFFLTLSLYWHVSAGNRTRAALMGGEHSSKELFESVLIATVLRNIYIWARDSVKIYTKEYYELFLFLDIFEVR